MNMTFSTPEEAGPKLRLFEALIEDLDEPNDEGSAHLLAGTDEQDALARMDAEIEASDDATSYFGYRVFITGPADEGVTEGDDCDLCPHGLTVAE